MANFSSFLLNISHLSIFNTEDTLLYEYSCYLCLINIKN